MANSAESAGGTARSRLTAAATLAATGLALSGTYTLTGLGIPCPWRYLTHTLCPFCGSTTLGAHLLHGDFAAAWAANQFVFVLLAGLVVAVIAWTVEALGGPAVRLPRALSSQRLWYVVLGAAALAFALVRNLVPLA